MTKSPIHLEIKNALLRESNKLKKKNNNLHVKVAGINLSIM